MMQQAMVNAGLITQEMAAQTNKEAAVDEELNKEKRLGQRRAALTRKLKTLVQYSADHPSSTATVKSQLDSLSDEYSDVFDEVATQQAWKLNLSSHIKQ